MAERVKHELIERGKLVDVVAGKIWYNCPKMRVTLKRIESLSKKFYHYTKHDTFSYQNGTLFYQNSKFLGPDSYRDLPRLLAVARGGSSAINVQLSLDETYADVVPVRQDEAARTAYVWVFCFFFF